MLDNGERTAKPGHGSIGDAPKSSARESLLLLRVLLLWLLRHQRRFAGCVRVRAAPPKCAPMRSRRACRGGDRGEAASRMLVRSIDASGEVRSSAQYQR